MDENEIDLIDRQVAIKAIEKLCEECNADYCGECRVKFDGLKNCKTILEQLPPVKPEPKVSEWIYGCSNNMGYSEDYDMTCKACGKSMLKNDYIFCPYCGSLNYIPHTEPAPISSKRVVDFEKGVVRYAKEGEE